MTGTHPRPTHEPPLGLVGDGEDPALEPLFEQARSRRGSVPNIQRAIGRSAPVTLAFATFSETVRAVPWLPAADVELVILRVAVLTACPYPFAHHVGPALAAGLSEEQVEQVWLGATAESFDGAQQTLLVAVDEVERGGGLSPGSVARLSARFAPSEIVELVALIGFYGLLARLANSTGAPVDDEVRHHLDRYWRP